MTSDFYPHIDWLMSRPLWAGTGDFSVRAIARATHARGVERAPMDASPSHQASAHMFIANPFSGRDVLTLLSTHPNVEDRVQRLEQMAYQRG